MSARIEDGGIAVHYGVAVVLGSIDGRAVRVADRIAGERVYGTVGERVVRAAETGVLVAGIEIAGVVRELDPLADIEIDLAPESVFLVDIRILAEHTLFAVVCS